MKIAIIVHNLTDGGAERVAALWAKGFSLKGHDVAVIIHNENAPVTYELPQNVRLIRFQSHLSNKYLRTLDRIWMLHNILKAECPDVIIDVMNDYWKRVAMIGTGAFKVSTEHNSFERPENATEKYNKWKKICLNRTYNHVTVLTQADKDVIGDKLRHVTVMPNPLAFKPADEVPQKQNVILAVGRLDAGHYKGFDILIKAFGMVSTDWSLQIAGSGTPASYEKYKKLAKECGVEKRVEFLGFVNNPISLYQKASIFVLSSRYEGFGLVLIEAMSQGCACVACDYKGRQKEIITSPKQGLICEVENVEALATALIKMIGDEEWRDTVRHYAIERSKDFTFDKIADRWENIFRNIKK